MFPVGSCDWRRPKRKLFPVHEPQLQPKLWNPEVDGKRRRSHWTLHPLWCRGWWVHMETHLFCIRCKHLDRWSMNLVFLQTRSWRSTTTCTVWATGGRPVTVGQTTALDSSGCSRRWGHLPLLKSDPLEAVFLILFYIFFFAMFPPECRGDGERGEGQERQAEAEEAEAAAGGQTHARILLFLLRRRRRAGDVWQEGLSQSVPPAVSQPHQAAIR